MFNRIFYIFSLLQFFFLDITSYDLMYIMNLITANAHIMVRFISLQGRTTFVVFISPDFSYS